MRLKMRLLGFSAAGGRGFRQKPRNALLKMQLRGGGECYPWAEKKFLTLYCEMEAVNGVLKAILLHRCQ
jgi:hypothetical protein